MVMASTIISTGCSFRSGCTSKPDPEIYKEVVRQTGINPADTLYIDDLPDNCASARQTVGWTVFRNEHFDDWLQLF